MQHALTLRYTCCLFKWIQDWIRSTEQYLKNIGSKSSLISVNSVLQEIFLVPPIPHPSLIIIYINYLSNSISSTAKNVLFAYDYINYKAIKSEEYIEMLQIHLDLDKKQK